MILWFAAAITKDSQGGVARSMHQLSKKLKSFGHSCTILYAENGFSKKNYFTFSIFTAIKLLLQIRKRPDWIIGRSTDSGICALVIQLFRLKTKTILYSHGWEEKVYQVEQRIPSSLISPKTTWRGKLFRFPFLRYTLHKSTFCVCGTLEESRWLKKKYPTCSHKIICIPNGVSKTKLSASYWSMQKKIPSHFLAIGNTTWKKNMGHSIQVFKEILALIPDAHLYIIGMQDSDILNFVQIETKVHITGIFQESLDAMDSWYKLCPYFISSSLYEGGRSLAILEAMSYGCIPFVSPIPSSLEIIHHNKNGFIVPSVNAQEDVNIISAILTQQDLIAQVRHKAFLYASRQSWERQAKRLERLLWKVK